MWKVLVFIIFMALTYVVALGNKNDKAFLLKNSLEQNFVKKTKFEEVINC